MKPIKAHKWDREANEHYCEPAWVSRRLFEEEKFKGRIWDPCCGFGTIPESARPILGDVYATDIIDRGYPRLDGVVDFLTYGEAPFLDRDVEPGFPTVNVVCNPPFNIAKEFSLHALSLADKVAMVFPTARLNAARWLQDTPLVRVWLMTPRPSMPPGHVVRDGGKAAGGKMDYCWLVFENGFVGSPEMKWLRRDAR